MSTAFTFDLHQSGAGASAASVARHGTVSITSRSSVQHGPSTKKRVIETPGCLMFSSKGSVPHLTPDNMRLQAFGGVHVSLEQLLHPDQPASFSKWPLASPFNSSSKFTLAEYLHLQDLILMCDLRDYASFSAFASPSSAASDAISSRLLGPNTDRYALLSTPKGVRQLTMDDYLQIVRQYRPDIMVALADNIVERKTKSSESQQGPAEKRVRKSVERSLKWLDQILLEREGQDGRMEDRRIEEEKKRRRERKEKKRAAMVVEQQQEGDAPEASSKETVPEEAESDTPIEIVPMATEPWREVALFAHVLGSHLEAERIMSAQETARRKGVDGFVIDTSALTEMVEMDQVLKLVEASVEHLPSQKPRIVYGVQTPEDVLRAIALGVDLFDTSYPYHLTEDGKASLYGFGEDPSPESVSAADNSSIRNNRWINLWDDEHGDKFVPIMEGCECYACKGGRHTRAYINHLLKTHEMLATVLLMSHNMHQYGLFFQHVRESIKEGTFEKHSKAFHETFGKEPKRTAEKHQAQLVVEAALTKRNQRLEGAEEAVVDAIGTGEKLVKKRSEVEGVEADKTEKKAKKEGDATTQEQQ
ncbi:Queuine tRNA-ribosyltransferase subunit qtrtd1 [Mortierella alpina]|uniref:Queuine tRNA-ribosyltransferase accessory subunit 2 n=1 Tax=Mortierella alpina TaxID=64518 RepID=A0A9P6M6B2_MORAP|nr:Queuine tRNA-ribosyltransferase subunit qtrtd1 [Mortierella alpina]